MNWTVNNARPRPDGKSWVAETQASLSQKAGASLAWESARLKVAYKPTSAGFYINLDPWYLAVEAAQGWVTLSKYIGGNLFEAWDIEVELDQWSTIEVSAGLSGISFTLNGQTFQYRSSVATPMTSIGIYPPEGAEFLEPEFEVTECRGASPLPPDATKPKTLEFTVDFFDDLQLTSFTPEMLDEMFRVMARLNASQAYWVHHGERGNGFWENASGADNIERTFDLVGDDYLPPAVQAAHKAGIALVGLFKPFDTAIMHTTGSASNVSGRALALGGQLDLGFNFPAAHPEICMQRRSAPVTGKRPRQITIRSRRELPVDCAGEVELHVSRDNVSYQLYQKALSIEVTGREMQLSGLEIQEEFVALSFSPDLAAQIENSLPLLVEVRDEDGGILEFTYGIAPRLRWVGEYHLDGGFEYRDFRQHGLNFDCAGHSVPSAVWNSRKRQLELFSPSNSHGVVGLAFNANTHVPAVLSESEPATHEWWLAQITQMLDAGVDGVEIRLMNHSNIIDWSLYGFNRPLVEEYQRRYGADITQEEFSREQFRALRGEFFTDFLRQASELVRERGKKFYLHLEDCHQGPADEPCPMEITMPWRQWIEERLCDGVTLKALNVWTNDTAFGREVVAACHARDIPVSFAPFIHSAFMSEQRDEILDSYLASSYDAFNVYEFGTLFKFTPQGEVETVDEAIIQWLSSELLGQEKLAPLCS